MSPEPIPLSYWQAMIAVVDHGGYAQAAEAMDKSQSSISYAIQRLEKQLGIPVFQISGRRAVPTPGGQALLERARLLVDHARSLEVAGRRMAQGRAALVRLAVDAMFPDWLLLKVLDDFSQDGAAPRIETMETVLSGTEEALLRRDVDMVITPRVPQGFVGEPLMPVRFVAVAAPFHPLHQFDQPLTWADLHPHRQLVLRDSGSQRENAGWLDAKQRWTFSHVSTSIRAATQGMGFAWYPELRIRDELADGRLKALPLAEGRYRHAWLYRVFTHPEFPGLVCQELANSFIKQVRNTLNGPDAPPAHS